MIVKNSLVSMLLSPNSDNKNENNMSIASSKQKTNLSLEFSSVFKSAVQTFPEKTKIKFLEPKELNNNIKAFNDELIKDRINNHSRKDDKVNSKKDKKDVDKLEKDGKDKNKELDDKYDVVVEGLAQLLGITNSKVEDILKNAEISKDMLVNGDTGEVVKKIASLLDLNSEQKVSLEKGFLEITKNLEKILEMIKNPSNDINGTLLKADIGKDVKKEMNEILLNQSGNEIKDALTGQETNQLTKEPNSIEELTNQKIEKTTEEKQVESVDKRIDSYKEPTNGQSTSQDSSKQQFGFVDKGGVQKADGNNESNKANNSFQNILTNIGNKIVENKVTMKNIPPTVPIDKSDVINQVIEKAKVSLSGGKSEMVLELKPDNLGKISLKVVSERGIVVAQMVAENEQVKALLESSMQTLKDELQKQGIEVQGFSVSVGEQSKEKEQKNERQDKNLKLSNNNNINKSIGRTGYSRNGFIDVSGDLARSAQHGFTDNTIDLTA